MRSHVVILGCGRSGTSIFGELFEAIPGYRYHCEPSFADVVRLPFDAATAIKVPTESAEHPAPSGLSFPIATLLEVLPEPRKLYWIIRHPYDAIASLRVGIANEWGHHPRPHDWRDWADRRLIEKCAHHWATINGDGYASVRDLVDVCRFEDMLEDPSRFALDRCEEIGVRAADHAAPLSKWSNRVQNSNNAHFVEAKQSRAYSRSDHAVRIGRWRENLTQDDVQRIAPIVSTLAAEFGYALEG